MQGDRETERQRGREDVTKKEEHDNKEEEKEEEKR